MTAESDCLTPNASVVSGRMATGGGVVDGQGVVRASGQWDMQTNTQGQTQT